MISRKNQQRLEWFLNAALFALVFNIAVPVHASTDNPRVRPTILRTETPVTKPELALPTIPDKQLVAKKILTVRSSAYSSTRDQTDNDPFTTASGSKVRDGIVAMNGVPFGTKIRIPEHFGDKIFVVEDRMHSRWGKKRVDIWMPSRQQAREWGVRTVTVEVL